MFGLSLRPRRSPIWRHRDFRRLWLGESISMVGSSISGFALPIVAIVTLHVTPGQMGLMRALLSAPTFVIGLVVGAWVDRVSRQRLLIVINLIAGALVASVPISHALGTLSVGHLFALAFAFGLLDPFWSPAWNAFLPSVVEPDLRVEANSKVMLTYSATGITGPGIGGFLVAVLSAPLAMLADAFSYLICVVFLAGVHTRGPEQIERADAGGLGAKIAEGLRVTFVDPMQRALTVPRAILDLIDAISLTVLVLYIIREVGLTPGLMGLAFALSSVGFVAGSLIAPRVERRLDIGGMIVLGLFMVAISPYTMVIANDGLPDAINVVFFAIPGLIGGTGGIIQHVGLMTLRQSITPERLLGRVWASADVLGGVMTVTGAILGGFLGETIGLRGAMVVAAVAYSIPFLYVWVSPLRRATRIAAAASEDGEPDDGYGRGRNVSRGRG
jgi:MFS family permease